MSKNLLAIIKEGDEESKLLKEFITSLPDETSVLLNSYGYIGSLTGNIHKFAKKNQRHFLILRAEDFEGVKKDYFAQMPQVALMEIEDKLKLKILLRQIDTDICHGGALEWEHEQDIESIVNLYKEINTMQPQKLLVELANKVKEKPSFMFKKTLLGKQLKLKKPSYIYCGLETLNQKYLLAVFGEGPFYNRGIYSIFGY